MNGQRVLVTGGAGFLGSHLLRHAVHTGAEQVVNLDALTYAGDLRRLADIDNDHRYTFVRCDITSKREVDQVIEEYRPDLLIHCAAESHVTRSEADPELFHRTNVQGTETLLGAAVRFGVRRFVHISTDEVYGPIVAGSFREEDKADGPGGATSAYAQSKGIADDLARSFSSSLEVMVARPTNIFGPHQFPEKAFSRWVTRGLRGEVIPVWGDALHVRQWLHAEDFVAAVSILSTDADPGTYNIGPRHDPEIANLDLARWLIAYLGLSEDHLLSDSYDRPEHDRRYSVDSSRIRSLGWVSGDVWKQFAASADWYRDHRAWWEPHLERAESIYRDTP